MKRVILWCVAILLIILSLGVAGYPFISDFVNSLHSEQEIVKYLDYIAEPPANKYDELLASAREYNKALLDNPEEISDPFTEDAYNSSEYNSQLSVPETDVMAAVRIPKIDVNLPIYHGTTKEVLEKGAGHLNVTSLPVGGEGTHAVVSAHTGFSNQRLFSDLNQVSIGDVFYISCFGEEMAYQVDQISVVTPDDTTQLQIVPGSDYVTLITCTPFGINTHRLLVRGTRIELNSAENIEQTTTTTVSTWNREYIKAIFLGLAVMGLILLIFVIIKFIIFLVKKGKKKSYEKDAC